MKRKKSLWARSGGEKRKQGKPERFFDYSLFFVVLFLVCFGLVMIYSTTAYTSSVENNGDPSIMLCAREYSRLWA